MQGDKPWNKFAIVSLTLGLIAFLNLGGLEKAIAAVVFGILALKDIARPENADRGEGLAAAGIVLGVISGILVSIFLYVFFNKPELLEQILRRPGN